MKAEDVFGWCVLLTLFVVMAVLVLFLAVGGLTHRIDKHRDWLCANTTMVKDCIEGGRPSLEQRIKELERQLEEKP